MYSKSLIFLFGALFLWLTTDAAALQLACTNDSRIPPFSEFIDTDKGVAGLVSPVNEQDVSLFVEDDSGRVSEVPRESWHLENPAMSYFWGSDPSRISIITTPVLSETGRYRFASPSTANDYAGWVFLRFQSTVVLDTEVRGRRLALRIIKVRTQSYADNALNGYTVVPGTAASWTLPDIVDMGEATPGETMSRDISGPTGAPGSVTVFDAAGDAEFIKVNGCGKGCTSPLGDGSTMRIEVSPPEAIPEGVYSLSAEATLLCD
ncbi:hypothetical protein I5466_16125 [Citrobacter koseri]|uniref:hypothetical protein n=1 Tax=Citrobacter koseri TaxID=545 RepID=UPI0019031AB9|nr:hypothetical protein [Citrobacter koseri]MBJ9122319.1 hypothetical protein [Citrobacter koseri]MBJ9245693.1 hypothetical protein [Citrobacter koseri]